MVIVGISRRKKPLKTTSYWIYDNLEDEIIGKEYQRGNKIWFEGEGYGADEYRKNPDPERFFGRPGDYT